MAGHVFAISARFVGRAVLVKDGPHRITLPEVAEDHAIYTVIHSISRRGADYHLVIGCSHLSRGWPPRGGYCGSGIESYVEWLHIHEGKIVEQREGLYESCFRNRDGYSIAWKNGVLRWSVSGVDSIEEGGKIVTKIIDYSWAYDPASPEKGIDEKSEESKN